MRIGINCFLLRQDIGGIKQYFVSLCEHILTHNREHQLLFFCTKESLQVLLRLVPGVSPQSVVQLGRQREIKKYITSVDVYFCPFGSLYPRPLPVPTVVTLVDIQEDFFPEFFSKKELAARYFHYRGSTSMADRVITISHFSKKTIEKHHKVSGDKIEVCHLSADERFYSPEKYASAVETELPSEYVLYPANFWHHKNHDVLLRAIAYLRDNQGRAINLILTGFTQENGFPLQEKLQEYRLNNQVHCLGYVSVEELIYLYVHAQFLVFPSLFEGFGIPLVEAMAAGCPVLCSTAASLPEVGSDSVEYFEPSSVEQLAEKMIVLLDDNMRRNQLKEAGRKRALDFSTEKMVEKHLNAFDRATHIYSSSKFLIRKHVTKYLHLLDYAAKKMM